MIEKILDNNPVGKKEEERHQRFADLSNPHREVLGLYFCEQQRRSLMDVKDLTAGKGVEVLIDVGARILDHISNGTPLDDISCQKLRSARLLGQPRSIFR